MKSVFIIARRELQAYFSSAIGWLFLLGVVTLSGFVFASLISTASDPRNALQGQPININKHIIPEFFSLITIILLFLSPALSMRLFSEDLKQKSFELLLSSPISSAEIVLGKFLGSLGYVAIVLLSLSHCTFVLFWLGDPDISVLAMNYLATFLTTACCMAVGMMFSSFTKSQLVALALSFITLLGCWFLYGIGQLAEGTLSEVLSFVSILSHIEQLSKGLLHTKDIIYFFSFCFLFLFATLQRIEAYRWQ